MKFYLKLLLETMFKRILLALLLFCPFQLLRAQTLPSYTNVHTPEVTAFNRNIETPVSMYSGVPSISIPLYEIEIKGVKVPITLDYHAGGIRVDQEATWVGLGWNLSYGGMISRKIRGSADEKSYFGATGDYSVNGYNSISSNMTWTSDGYPDLSNNDILREQYIED